MMASTPPADTGTPNPGPQVENLQGGGMRYTPETPAPDAIGPGRDPTTGEPITPAAEPGLPEGYTDWAAYGRDVASGKVTPANQAADAGAEETGAAKDTTTQGTPEEAAFAEKLAPFSEEFLAKGDLSPESLTKAAKEFGVSEPMVKLYMEGVRAEQSKAQAPFMEAVGGDWVKFNEWASGALDAKTLETLNGALAGDNPDAALLALRPFADQFKASGVANPPTTLTRGEGAGAGGNAQDVYKSMDEQMADQRTDLYRNSETERQRVMAKVSRSGNY